MYGGLSITKATNLEEPWLAVALSGFLPGLGQLYAGQRLLGGLWLLGWLLLVGVCVYCILATVSLVPLGLGRLLVAFS